MILQVLLIQQIRPRKEPQNNVRVLAGEYGQLSDDLRRLYARAYIMRFMRCRLRL